MLKIDEVIVFCVILLSGTLVPFIFGSGIGLWLFAFLLFLFLHAYRNNVPFGIPAFSYFLLIVCSSLLTALVNLDVDFVGTYFGIIFRLAIGLLVCSIISPNRFFVTYVNIFYYYAIISLVLYSIAVLHPEGLLTLPSTYNDAGTGYRHLFIYFYQGLDSWNYRNAGLFWEGGAYSAFLFFALLISLHLKFHAKKIFALFLAILTTGSTTGIAASIIVLLASKRFKVKYKIYSMIILLAFFPILFDLIEAVFISKFVEENISYLDRSIGIVADLRIFLNNPFFGSGFSKHDAMFLDIANSLGSFAPTSSNSFTGILAVFGILYAILIFIPIFILYFKLEEDKHRSIINILAVIIVYSSQGIIYFPMSYVFLFYGIYHINGKHLKFTATSSNFLPFSVR